VGKWEMVKLSDVGKVVTGNTPPTKNPEYYSSSDIAFYKPNDLTETEVSYLDSATVYVSKLAKSKIRLLPKGSVLVTCIGIIGKVGIALGECTCNQQINAIIPNTNKLDSSFLAYSIVSRKGYIQSIANAPVVPIVNKTQFSNVKIPLPPLETQKHIAKTLDTAAQLLAMRKQQLAELDNLIKSTFHEMFGDPDTNEKCWDTVALGNCIDRIESGWSPICEDRRVLENEWGICKLSAITRCYYKETENKAIIKDTEIKEALEVKNSDLLFCRKNTFELVGNCAYVFVTSKKLMIPDTIFRFITKGNIHKIYLWCLLNIKTFKPFIQRLAGGSSGSMPNVSKEKLKGLIIPLPPSTLQNQFAAIVTKIEEQKSLVQKAVDETQYLLDSLMSEYFIE